MTIFLFLAENLQGSESSNSLGEPFVESFTGRLDLIAFHFVDPRTTGVLQNPRASKPDNRRKK